MSSVKSLTAFFQALEEGLMSHKDSLRTGVDRIKPVRVDKPQERDGNNKWITWMGRQK